MKKFMLLSTTSVLLMMTCSALAETVTRTTVVESKSIPNVVQVNFSAFDRNKNGTYSMSEVGERLFEAFDIDHNQMVDNQEWSRKTVMTIIPMEKATYTFVDFDDDRITDRTTYTYETFYEGSGLAKFDINQNGLSAAEFIDTGFQKLDDDEDNLISLQEWKEAYMMTRPEHDQPETYNP